MGSKNNTTGAAMRPIDYNPGMTMGDMVNQFMAAPYIFDGFLALILLSRNWHHIARIWSRKGAK